MHIAKQGTFLSALRRSGRAPDRNHPDTNNGNLTNLPWLYNSVILQSELFWHFYDQPEVLIHGYKREKPIQEWYFFYDLIMRYNGENLKFRMIRIKQIVKSSSVSFIVSITDIETE